MVRDPANDNKGILPRRMRRDWRVYSSRPLCPDLSAYGGITPARLLSLILLHHPAPANAFRSFPTVPR